MVCGSRPRKLDDCPHGVHLDTDLTTGVDSSGTWLALGVTLIAFAYAAARSASTRTKSSARSSRRD